MAGAPVRTLFGVSSCLTGADSSISRTMPMRELAVDTVESTVSAGEGRVPPSRTPVPGVDGGEGDRRRVQDT